MSCERNSSYSFLLIFLKLCRCFLHGVRMCMWFGYNCWIFFLSLFPLCELSPFFTSMYRQWVPCERNSSYNFIPIFLKLCTCFLHGLKMCMWFGYNPCIYCRTCFSMGHLGVQVSVRLFIRLSVRPSVCPSVNIYHGCLVSATPLTVFY